MPVLKFPEDTDSLHTQGTARGDLERLDFPKTLFYSKIPYVATTIERPPYWVEGENLIFLKFFMRHLTDGSIPEDVWLQVCDHGKSIGTRKM